MQETPNNLNDLYLKLGSIPFDDWILQVSEAVSQLGLGLSRSAKLVDVTSAEMFAIMKLATLPDESIKLFKSKTPPKTTWLLLASASPEEIELALNILEVLKRGQSPFEAVKSQLTTQAPEQLWVSATQLPPEALKLAAGLAEEYSALTPRQRTALKNFAAKAKKGDEFTIPQAKFLSDLLKLLVEQGVVKSSSSGRDSELQKLIVACVEGL
jgi:hypothetical protein